MTEPAHHAVAEIGEDGTSSWRFPVGVTIFVLGFAAPLAIPLVVVSKLPSGWKTVLSGALALGLPEVLMVAAAAVMGREGFAELKRRLGRFFKKFGPPGQVSRTRYRVGLVMFTLPLLLAWFGPYVQDHLPGVEPHRLWWHAGSDLMLIASLFVLGGEFWDKLRALFVQTARAVFAETEGEEGSSHE